MAIDATFFGITQGWFKQLSHDGLGRIDYKKAK
jgi:hypothetical protein